MTWISASFLKSGDVIRPRFGPDFPAIERVEKLPNTGQLLLRFIDGTTRRVNSGDAVDRKD